MMAAAAWRPCYHPRAMGRLDAVRPAGSPILVGDVGVVDPSDEAAAEAMRRKYPTRPHHLVDWNDAAKRYSDLVYSVPLKRGLQPADAKDVFQEVWKTALSKADVPEDQGMAPWLAAIAYWKTLSFLGGRRRHASSDEFTDELGDGDQLEPSQILQHAEEEQRVREALAKLPPRDRLLLHELFMSERPRNHAEIAADFGLAPGSVGQLRQRALDRLSKLVEIAAA